MTTPEPGAVADGSTVALGSDPWGPMPRGHQIILGVFDDEASGTDDGQTYSWEELSGPFCSCGDFGCPGGKRPQDCPERSGGDSSVYPEHWTDKDIDEYEFELAIYAARTDNHEDAQRAAAQLTLYDR
ncbi:hypothetical protein [Mycolicibacterium fortuitum]